MLTFSMAHPFITLFVLFLLICLVDAMWIRGLKAMIVWKHGYPPEHCDSFGNQNDN